MKIQINATGKFEDVPLRIAQRKINKGIAHIIKEEVRIEIVEVGEIEEPIKKIKRIGKKKKNESNSKEREELSTNEIEVKDW